MATAYEARAAETWRLVHDERQPMKTVASLLKVSLAEAFEMLAFRKAELEVRNSRRAALGCFTIAPLHSTKGTN
jgi:hypothetical protein